jgi:hypothetical protein
MEKENEIIISTESGVKVSISEWDDGGAWLHLQLRGGSAHTVLTKDEAQRLLEGLQAILKVAA